MTWQDTVISVANIFFALSLIAQIYYGYKEKVGPIKFPTSIPSFLGLYAMSVAYWSLGLYYSAMICVINGTLWLTLFAQRLAYNKKQT